MTTVKKKFSHIDSVSRFSDWERAVRLINYMRGTFIEFTYLITYGSGALNTISCEVLWTGRGESRADNFALGENQAMGARISSFALIIGQQFL